MSAPRNPHCQEQWPHRQYASRDLASAHHASLAASTVARLLIADSAIRCDMAHSDAPATEAQPFTPDVHWGLQAALDVCLKETVVAIERLAEEKGGFA